MKLDRHWNLRDALGDSAPIFDDERVISYDGISSLGLTKADLLDIEASVEQKAWNEDLTVVRQSNRELYPMLASVRALNMEFERHIAYHIPLVVSAWKTVLRAFPTNAQLQQFLGVPDALRPWVDAARSEDYRVDFCRFDLVGNEVGNARIVEFNANCPGGVLFTGAFRRLWAEAPGVMEVFADWQIAEDALTSRNWFAQTFYAATGAHPGDRIALFHQPAGNVLEIAKMRRELESDNCDVIVTHPGSSDWNVPGLRAAYLKYGVQASLADIDGWDDFLSRTTSGEVPIINPLPGRWIGDNKLCLAVLSDPRFAGLFSDAEAEAITRLIPFSRKAGDGIAGSALIEDQHAWVVKGPYDTQGRSVYVGSELGRVEWANVVGVAVEKGWLVQAAIEPSRVSWAGKNCYQDLSVVLLQGQFGGYTSRISENFKVNVAQGGGRQMVFGNRDVVWNAS